MVFAAPPPQLAAEPHGILGRPGKAKLFRSAKRSRGKKLHYLEALRVERKTRAVDLANGGDTIREIALAPKQRRKSQEVQT